MGKFVVSHHLPHATITSSYLMGVMRIQFSFNVSGGEKYILKLAGSCSKDKQVVIKNSKPYHITNASLQKWTEINVRIHFCSRLLSCLILTLIDNVCWRGAADKTNNVFVDDKERSPKRDFQLLSMNRSLVTLYKCALFSLIADNYLVFGC